MRCYHGVWFLHAALGAVAFIFTAVISYLVLCMYYETKYGTHNPTAKLTSKCDLFLMYVKVIMVVVYTFISRNGDNQWIYIFFLMFFSLYLAYSFYEHQPYFNKITMKMHNALCLVYLYTNGVLLIAKCLEHSAFNGALGLLFIGLPIVVLIVVFEKDKVLSGLVESINKNTRGDKTATQIQSLLNIIDQKDTYRNANILLRGYIEKYEETCSLKDCALKKYLSSYKTSNIDAVVFLLQHCEYMYQAAISKFPNNTSIRISYAFFLLERMNKKQQASLELANTEKHFPSFEEEFIIFRYKKLLEEQTAELGDNEDNLDVVSNIEYKNHFNTFKNSIAKVATLYLEFWSLLSNPNQDCQEDLTKLNDYGTKINVLVEDINSNFEKIQKLKHNDKPTIKYYADFLNDILNDKDKAQSFKTLLGELEDAKHAAPDENNLMNFDLNTLNSNSEYQYIIVSAQPEKFGVITNCSLGICSMFGYTRSELIGKPLETIMPEIFHKSHKDLLWDKLNEYKKQFVEVDGLKNYKPQFKDVSTFGRNKSRYLVQMTFKTTLIPTENNDNVFIAKIWQDLSALSNSKQSTCYVITNSYLTIQNFTPNAVNLLGMASAAINSSVEITEYIKQFYEEFLRYAIEVEDKSQEQKLIIKRSIINKRFRTASVVNWKRYDSSIDNKATRQTINNYNNNNIDSDSNNGNAQSRLTNDIGWSRNTGYKYNEYFILTVTDLVMKGKMEGYAFKFETLSHDSVNTMKNLPTLIHGSNKNLSIDKLIKHSKKDKDTHQSPLLCPSLHSSQQLNTLNESINNSINSNTPTQAQAAPALVQNAPTLAHSFIDQNFIPNSALNFLLDPKALSFKVNTTTNTTELKEYLKAEAYKKITPIDNKEHIKSTSSLDDEEEEESDDDDNDNDNNNTSSFNINSSNVSAMTEEKEAIPFQPKTITRPKGTDEYYKVDLTHIKFSIYNFNKKMVVEVKNWDKVDQVEYRTLDEHKATHLDDNMLITDFDYKDNGNNNSNNAIAFKNDNARSNTSMAMQNENDINKENILIKQIDYALGREEAQPSIAKLRWVAFISILVILGIGTAILVILLNAFTTLNENTLIIFYAYQLLIMNSYGVYYTRELTLLNDELYTKLPSERSAYITSCLNNTINIFTQSHELITYIMTTFLSISPHNSQRLNQHKITTTIIEDIQHTNSFNLSMNTAFIQANTALFHIGHYDLKNVIPSNKDTFFYLRNSLDNIYFGFLTQGEIFLDELAQSANSSKTVFIVVLVCVCGCLIAIYFCMSVFYEEVAKRKESYLEVFFEIGNNVVKNSLEKCEMFTKRMQYESISDSLSANEEDDLMEDKMTLGKTQEKGEHRTKRTYNSSRETKLFKLKIFFVGVILSIFCILLFVFYWLFLDDVQLYMKLFQHVSLIENNYLTLFNALREFMFDKHNIIQGETCDVFLNRTLEDFYDTRQSLQTYINNNIHRIPGTYHELYTHIYVTNACEHRSEYFQSEQHCQQFMSHSTNFGLEVMLTYFVEEIRYAKSLTEKANIDRNNVDYDFNLTYLGTEQYKQQLPNDTSLLNIEDYNKDDVHLNMNIMFNHLIITNHNVLRDNFSNCVNTQLRSMKLTFILVLAAFLGVVVVVYFGVWVPFEKQLNQTIYKTKNMLCIIPKEVLASLTNIHKLLDIGQTFNKASNRMMQQK